MRRLSQKIVLLRVCIMKIEIITIGTGDPSKASDHRHDMTTADWARSLWQDAQGSLKGNSLQEHRLEWGSLRAGRPGRRLLRQDRAMNSAEVIPAVIRVIIIFITSRAKHQPIRTEQGPGGLLRGPGPGVDASGSAESSCSAAVLGLAGHQPQC